MKPVALVIPPSPFLVSDRSFPFLGVLWVAAALREKGVPVEVLDLSGREGFLAKVASWALERRPSDYALVGITSTTAQYPYARGVLGTLKTADPGWRVAIGGAHPTVQPQSCRGFDRVVMDDGMSGVFLALEEGAPWEIAGPLTDMGAWPLPARDLIHLGSYQATLQDRKCTNVMWSTGCPMRCQFCVGRHLDVYRKQRRRPVDHILYELDHLAADYGIRAFWAFDDEVNISRDWLTGVCEALGQRGYIWRAFVKAELFMPAVARAMAKGGCVEIGFGAESGSARILQVARKSSTPEINGRVVQLAHEAGMRVKAFCMVGLPSETLEDVWMTRDWLLQYRPDDFDLTVYTPYPGSPVYHLKYPGRSRGATPGLEPHAGSGDPLRDITFPDLDFAEAPVFYKGEPGRYRPVAGTSALAPDQIGRLRDQVDFEVRRELGIPVSAAGKPLP